MDTSPIPGYFLVYLTNNSQHFFETVRELNIRNDKTFFYSEFYVYTVPIDDLR